MLAAIPGLLLINQGLFHQLRGILFLYQQCSHQIVSVLGLMVEQGLVSLTLSVHLTLEFTQGSLASRWPWWQAVDRELLAWSLVPGRTGSSGKGC